MSTSSDTQTSDQSAKDSGRAATPAVHVVIMDGTMSTLCPGMESNAGLAFKLIAETGS